MIEQLSWLREFIVNYPSLQYVTVFLGASLGGEIALLTLSFLSAQGLISPVGLMIFSFLGTLTSDSMWFILGRTKTAGKIITHKYAHSTVSVIAEAVRRVSRGSHFAALVFAKFLVGTRIVMLLYLSHSTFSFRQFIRYNALATVIWLLVVIPVGFLSGLGFTYIADVFHNIYVGVGFIILVILVLVIVELWLKKIFTHLRDR